MKTKQTVEEIYKMIDEKMIPLSSGYHWFEEREELKVESIKAEDEERQGIGTSNFELKSELKQQFSTFEKLIPSSLCSLAAGTCFAIRHNHFIKEAPMYNLMFI